MLDIEQMKKWELDMVKEMRRVVALIGLLLFLPMTNVKAQTEVTDSIMQVIDSMYAAMPVEAALPVDSNVVVDTTMVQTMVKQVAKKVKPEKDWSTWRPDPQRALWMAMVIPGGGQIYNRKYWKLPIVYGGFMGCVYALMWNNMMYKDYQQAYLDIMDDDPTTASYNKFLHLGRTITPENEERYKSVFKSRKDRYRRWRDLSFFCMVGVYVVSVIDAYVDAELSEFDISKDLSMKVRPTVMGNGLNSRSLSAASFGVNCSINF